MIRVKAIKLPDDFDSYEDVAGKKAEFLEPISKINIFVGANNSGKSRFMRLLSSQTEYEIKQDSHDLKTAASELSSVLSNIENFMTEHNLTKISGVDKKTFESLQMSIDDLLTIGKDRYENLRTTFAELNPGILKLEKDPAGSYLLNNGPSKIIYEVANKLVRKAKQILEKIPVQFQANSPKKVYLPTLRGLRPLDPSHKDFYLERTRQDYFPYQISGGEETPLRDIERKRPEIFTGLTFYQRLTDLLLGDNVERKLIDKYQKFISENLFENKPIQLIPKQKERVVFVKIGKEEEQPIHHLGDGVQSAIILSFLPFVMQKQTFFFIEEPEMYLHPGLQRKILNFYNSSACKNHTFFLTTHSNHFLDLTIDIKEVSIFTFRKNIDESAGEDDLKPAFVIEAVDSDCKSSLELLGVRNSSVFLVNATIWVEGITDRWYLRKMLVAYMVHLEGRKKLPMQLEEDNHYSFVEYGGANITHWSFLDYETHPIEVDRLCAKAIVVIDKDGEKKEKRKEDLKKILRERLVILPCREVENLLSYKVIKEVVEEYEKNNALKLKEYDYAHYKDIYLGKFINDVMLKKAPSRIGGYKEASGTLKNKVNFCERALNKIKYEDLPASTKNIIKTIYEFIHSQNA